MKNRNIICFILIAASSAFTENNKACKDLLSDYYGRLVCMAVAVPIGVLVVTNITDDIMHAPDDSVLYLKSNEPYTVSDYNNESVIKMGAFLLIDIIVSYYIGDRIDNYRKTKNKERTSMINIDYNALRNEYAITSKWSF